MMLLIKYPEFLNDILDNEKSKYQKHFAYILLNLLLGCGDSESKIMSLVTQIRESSLDGMSMLHLLCNKAISTPSDSKYLEGSLNRLLKLKSQWRDITDVAHNKDNRLKQKLNQANAVNNRYVLLLYALERANNAKDFYGDDIPKELIDSLENNRRKIQIKINELRTLNIIAKDQENDIKKYKSKMDFLANLIKRYKDAPVVIKVSVTPERQHIVPYSVFHSNDNSRKGRISNDPVNNIGNLTYISHDLNHYETGLGALWLNLNQPNDGHIISSKAIELYVNVKNAKDNKSKQTEFETWIEKRQTDIANAFAKWIMDIQKKLSFENEIIPIPQANAILLQDDESFAENAFLPTLWHLNINEDKQKLSWYAFCPGMKLCKSKESGDWEIQFKSKSKNYKQESIKLKLTDESIE